MQEVSCGPHHVPEMLGIINDAITNSTARWDYHPWSQEDMADWLSTKLEAGLPVFGFADAQGRLAGYGSYGLFRSAPAYKYTVEHSIYIHQDFQRQGLGRRMLHRLLERAEKQQYHTLIGVISADNQASIDLHLSEGFERVGTLRETGYKFGEWMDLALLQKLLGTPAQPRAD